LFLAKAVGFGSPGGYQASKRPITTILLVPDTTSTLKCHAEEPIPLRASNGDALIWNVRNTCAAPFFVRVDNFRLKQDDGSLLPADPQNPPVKPANQGDQILDTHNAVQQNGSGSIPGKVVRALPSGVTEEFYKYDILISPNRTNWTTVRDPDIDIWPF
jgi:hypothetical protein